MLSVLIFAQEEEQGERVAKSTGMNANEEGTAESNPISVVTEYIGIFVIGTSLGLLIAPSIIRRNIKTILELMTLKKMFIIVSVIVLTIAAGIIHILLIKEHMEESYIWGIGFLVMGVLQLAYAGIFMMLTKTSERWEKRRAVLAFFYSVGIIGNIFLVAIFIYARLFVPPFSPEGVPVNEVEINGVLTVIIELFVTGLLIYLLRAEKGKIKPFSNYPVVRS
jgi:hypothetical protein